LVDLVRFVLRRIFFVEIKSKKNMAYDPKLALIIGGYAFCSSTLLVLNKVALEYFPSSNAILGAQFLTSAIFAKVMEMAGQKVDALEMKKVKAFLPAVLCFYAALFCNFKSLQNANVDAVIVFRCSTPIIVAICEYWFMDREMPNTRSWFSLLAIVIGSIVFALLDKGLTGASYFWLIIYTAVISFDMLYVRHVVESVPMTTWGRVYYNNLLSLPPALLLFILFREDKALSASTTAWSMGTLGVLLISCVVGVGISATGFYMRSAISALSYTVVAVVNKIATVLLNTLMWDKHAPMGAIFGLMVCIGGSTLYQQPPMRKKPVSAESISQDKLNGIAVHKSDGISEKS